MAIDIRALTTCSLGELVQGSISDSYIQENGLILTSGSCVINDIITPSVGDIVTFTYVRNSQAVNIPRKMRVLSSFADPIRRITQVKLGCKLTYLSDWQEPDELLGVDDPQNASYSTADTAIITVPVHASSVLNYCLQQLEITASSNPLTNKFSIEEFNLSGGYVNIINKLLVSECYCGYLDYNETLQIINLNQDGGTGPVLTRTDLIELDALGFGEMPADNLYVSYSTLKLKQPESASNYNQANSDGYDFEQLTELRNWERQKTIGSLEEYPIVYIDKNNFDEDGNQLSIQTVFSGRTESETITKYKIIRINEYDPVTRRTKYKSLEVVDYRETITKEPLAKSAPAHVAAMLINAPTFSGNQVVESQRVKEEYIYDQNGNQTGSISYLYQPPIQIALSCDLPAYIEKTQTDENGNLSYTYEVVQYGSYSSANNLSAKTTVQNSKSGKVTQTYTVDYQAWLFTKAGQKAVADAKVLFLTVSQAVNFFLNSLSLVFVADQTTLSESGATQARPSQAERNNAANADPAGNPNNGYRVDSQSAVSLITGTLNAKRVISFSLPYAPDDTFSKSGGIYISTASDAATKALNYGRIQNKLLIGNRNGMSIQADPDSLPTAPYSPIIIQIEGLSVLYRINAMSWAFNAGGVVVGVDALFWGAIGGTGTGFWFPVAPGVVTLPSTPPVVDGQMTVETTIPPWNEAVKLVGIVRSKILVKSYDYSLNSFTNIGTIKIRTRLATYSTGNNLIAIPATDVEVIAYAPFVQASGIAVQPPVRSILVAGNAPSIEIVSIDEPGVVLAFTTIAVTLQALAPAIATGVLVDVSTLNITLVVFEETETPSTGTGDIILNEIFDDYPVPSVENYISDTFSYSTGSTTSIATVGGFIAEQILDGIPIVEEFFIGNEFGYTLSKGVSTIGYVTIAIGNSIIIPQTVQISVSTSGQPTVSTGDLSYYYSMPIQMFTWQEDLLPPWWGN